MVLGRLHNEFQNAYNYEEDDREEDSNGSEPIELDADDYWDSFSFGEKEQLEWWYLKNSGPQLQLYYTNEDYYQDQVEEGEAEAYVDAEEEEAQGEIAADQDESQANQDYYQDQVEEEEAKADIHAEEEEVEAEEDDYGQQMKGILPVNCSVAPLWTVSLSSGAHEHSQEEGPQDAFAQGAHGTSDCGSMDESQHSNQYAQKRVCRCGKACKYLQLGQCVFRHV